MFDGDILIVDRFVTAQHGGIVVATLNKQPSGVTYRK
ncbi:MAG: hypothetical protein ACRCT7_11580 [Shewanella sp.]